MGEFKKSYKATLFKSWIIGCGVVLALTISAQARGDEGGRAYCGKEVPKTHGPWSGAFEFPLDMGTPENWPNSDRVDIRQAAIQSDEEPRSNIDTDEVPPELKNEMKRKGQYVFPCAILKDMASWKRYWLNDSAAKQRIKVLKQTHGKYMDCLYDHRKEINKLNKKVIEHTCKKRTGWKPPGFESVAEGEM